MKKLILSIVLLAGMTFVACSDEDNKVTRPTYTGCQTCEILAINGESREDYEVCVDADGVAYVADANTGIAAADYFTMYCDNAYGGTTTPGDGGTPDVNCVTCAAFTEGTTKIPESEICKSDSGKAIVAGVVTTVDYDIYITELTKKTSCK